MGKGTLKDKKITQDKERQAYAFYVSQGWTPEQAIGIVGNLIRESNLNTTIVGTADDKGSQGVAQWHGDRLKTLKNKYGNNWTDFKNQLEFVDWELKNTEKAAGDKLRNAKGVWEAGTIVSDHYERPKVKFVGDETRQRHVSDLAMKFKGIKLTPEDMPYANANYANSVAPYMNQQKEIVTNTINNFDFLPQTTTFASVPDSAQKENKTEETDKDIAEVEQKTKEFNFLDELNTTAAAFKLREKQQIEAPQTDYMQQYEQISQFIENPQVAQQGKKFKLQDERNLVQKDNISTNRPNTIYNQKELENISTYATKNNISIKDASERLYNANQHAQNNQVRTYVPQSTKSKVWEVATHPITAAGYAVRNEDLPENFSRGTINPHEMAVDIVNPFFYADQAGQAVKNTSEGDFVEAGMNTLNLLPLAAEYQTLSRGLSKVGKVLGTEEGLLSNAYKLNPKAITSESFNNPNSFYRQVDTPTFNEGLESGLIKGKQNVDMTRGESIINLNKSFGDDAYYKKGSLYSPQRADYIYEVQKGEESFIPKVNNRTRNITIDQPIRVSKTPIPLEESTIYKKDWLQGYKEVPQLQQGGGIDKFKKKPFQLQDERNPVQKDNTPNTKRDLSLMLAEYNNAKKDEQELRTTGQIKNPNSIQYRRNIKTQPDIKQDNISTEQRNAPLNPLQRPLIYLANPEKVLGDLGVPGMETSELDRQAINTNKFNPNQSGTDRFLNNAKIGLGYVPEATVNTALAAAFMPEGSGALGLVNEALNPLAGIKTSIPDGMKQGLNSQGFLDIFKKAKPTINLEAPAINDINTPLVNASKNLEDLNYAKDWAKQYGYQLPENLERVAQSDELTNRTIRGMMNRHNTFVRGVSTNWDKIEQVNPEILRHLEGKGIDWKNNPKAAAEYMSTHVPIQTGYGRAGLNQEVFKQGQDAIYTSNSIPTAEGYTYGQGYITMVKKPTDFSSVNRQDWITQNSPTYYKNSLPKSRSYSVRDLDNLTNEKTDALFNQKRIDETDRGKILEYFDESKKIKEDLMGRYKINESTPDDVFDKYLDELNKEKENLSKNLFYEDYSNKILRTERKELEKKDIAFEARQFLGDYDGLNSYNMWSKNQPSGIIFNELKPLEKKLQEISGKNLIGSDLNGHQVLKNKVDDLNIKYRELKNDEVIDYVKNQHPDVYKNIVLEKPYAHYLHIGTPGEKILEPVKSWEITPDIWKNKSRAHTNEYSKKLSALSTLPIAGASYLATQGQEEPKKFQQGGNFTENELAFLSEIAIKDNQGQRNHPNKVTKIEGNVMATDGYGDIPLYVIPNKGKPKVVNANTGQHKFKEATEFIEIPLFKK